MHHSERLIVEPTAVEQLVPVRTARLLTHPELTGIRTGLLIDLDVPRLTDGIVRLVRQYRGARCAAVVIAVAVP